MAAPPITVLLVDDQPIIAQAMHLMLRGVPDISLHYCSEASAALPMAQRLKPSVILQDLMMPGVDGLEMVVRFRECALCKEIPLIMLSAREEADIKSKAFALGANDYLVKLPDKREVLARLRYHAKAYHHWLELNQALDRLQEDIRQAQRYVASMLPAPLANDALQASWLYHPCNTLGGDIFGYHALDEQHWAFYLLDVCGHGVGAALLAVSVAHTLRNETLPEAQFRSPASVLTALDKAFPMQLHSGMYFTLWYGVYHVAERRLTFASAGHPSAILLAPGGPHWLQTPNIVIGSDFGLAYQETQVPFPIPPQAELYIPSDGLFEVSNPQGELLGQEGLLGYLQDTASCPLGGRESHEGQDACAALLARLKAYAGSSELPDDCTLLKLKFL
jgi:sigma-B regulation protein RsbU (phosphoserine phosphatase)